MASVALKMGIKCKKIPERFEPIIDMPLIQKMKDAKPGNRTTYDKVNINGKCMFSL